MSFALTLALLVPQGQDELFKVDLGKDPPRVSANRAAVASDTSLKELARAVAWRIEFETRELELDLSRAALDLSFDDQSPRTIAHLIAVASGADVSFDDRGEAAGIVTVLHVIRPPSAVSESGRDRLRRNAATWYQSFLSEDLRHDPLVQEEGIQARMHYGTMLMKQGDLQTAARVFQSIFDENRTHDAVPQALLSSRTACSR